MHGDVIDEEVKFRFCQGADLKPTFQRRRYHCGRPRPKKRSGTLGESRVERDCVMQCIMRTSAVWFKEPVADQWFNLFVKGKGTTQDLNPTARDRKMFQVGKCNGLPWLRTISIFLPLLLLSYRYYQSFHTIIPYHETDLPSRRWDSTGIQKTQALQFGKSSSCRSFLSHLALTKSWHPHLVSPDQGIPV